MQCALTVVQLGYLQEAAGRRIKIVAFGDYQRILSAVSDQKTKLAQCCFHLWFFLLRKLHVADFYCQLRCFFFFFVYWFLSYLQRDLSEPREERAVHRAGVARNVSDEDEG